MYSDVMFLPPGSFSYSRRVRSKTNLFEGFPECKFFRVGQYESKQIINHLTLFDYLKFG